MRTRLISAVLAVGAIAVTAPTAVAGTTALPITTAADLVATGSRVFISGGPSTTSVVVARSDGRVETQLRNLPGPTDLQLSADGRTLYVALYGGGGIAVFDTRTLRQRGRYDTGGTCLTSLALSGKRLWFGYECGPAGPNVGVVDLAARPPATHLELVESWLLLTAPLLTASGSVLITGEPGISPARLIVFSAAPDGSLTKVRVSDHTAIGSNLRDIVVSANGETIFVACGAPYEAQAFAVDDLTQPKLAYPTGPYPNNVELSPDNTLLAAGADAAYDPDVFVYRVDGTHVATIELGPGNLFPKALAWSPDGSRLYAVSEQYPTSATLHVLTIAH